MTYEARIARLEEIVVELEGNVDLSSALALFEEGIENLRAAAAELDNAKTRVQRLIEHADGTFETEARE